MAIDDIIDIQTKVLIQLASYQELSWKLSYGEVHGDYQELPIWILLYEVAELELAHPIVLAVLSKYEGQLEGFKFTIGYYHQRDGREAMVEYFEGMPFERLDMKSVYDFMSYERIAETEPSIWTMAQDDPWYL